MEFFVSGGMVNGKGDSSGLWYATMDSERGDSGAPVFDATDGKVVGLQIGAPKEGTAPSRVMYVIPINRGGSLLLDYAGVRVPTKEERVDTVVPTTYSNDKIQCQISSQSSAAGYCAVTQCQDGQWVRGTAALLRDGYVTVQQGLETDRHFGVCGQIEFNLVDSDGVVLGSGNSQNRCILAKSSDYSRPLERADEKFPEERVYVPAPIANRTAKIQVSAVCTGKPNELDEPPVNVNLNAASLNLRLN